MFVVIDTPQSWLTKTYEDIENYVRMLILYMDGRGNVLFKMKGASNVSNDTGFTIKYSDWYLFLRYVLSIVE